MSARAGYPKWAHRMALATACLLPLLLFVGAGVTSKGAGMAFPDWPTSNAHLLNPPGWLQQDDKLWEHGHRLVGWVIGMLATAMMVLSWRCGGLVRKVTVAAFLAIGVQGVMGGLRVIQVSTLLAMLHGIWGQVCFCLVATAALVTSRAWHRDGGALRVPHGGVLQKACLLSVGCVFLQLVLGGALRHFALEAALVAHLLWAMIVALVVGWVVLWLIGQHPFSHVIGKLAWGLGGLTACQLLLGGAAWIFTVMGRAPSPLLEWFIPSLHVVVGALILALTVLLSMCSFHMFRREETESVNAPAARAVAS